MRFIYRQSVCLYIDDAFVYVYKSKPKKGIIENGILFKNFFLKIIIICFLLAHSGVIICGNINIELLDRSKYNNNNNLLDRHRSQHHSYFNDLALALIKNI